MWSMESSWKDLVTDTDTDCGLGKAIVLSLATQTVPCASDKDGEAFERTRLHCTLDHVTIEATHLDVNLSARSRLGKK